MSFDEKEKLEIDIDNYSGPLEVLLDLAKAQKVDLANISITQLADQFIEFINSVKKINLELEKGEILGILGENGAGKTTLIKLMVGLLHPTKGDVIIDGYSPWKRTMSI